MTGMGAEVAFETLIYTDCRADQGLRGQVGLQFQARSAGADEAAMQVVQANLLYEPPTKWMGERRPVEAYPPSFAHVWKGWLATAAGVYLGREVNGGREGNSLTHSIVTRDPDAYGLVRPAQLFGADFWTGRPAPTTSCPAVDEDWNPGPFGIAEAKAFVTGSAAGGDLLTALVSTLERIDRPDRRRILFIGEDPMEIIHWIAAATLLIPQDQALAVGFKVYSTDPSRASQEIVAVHPDWGSTPARVDNDLGYVVVDLTKGSWSSVVPTSHAAEWVAAFCTEKPVNVVDAIEVAANSGLPVEVAPLLGRCVIMHEPVTLASAEIFVRWLHDTPPELLAEHRGTLVDQLTVDVERWPPEILLGLDEVARTGQVPADRIQPVRLALIRSEMTRAARDGVVSDVVLPALPAGLWRDEDQYVAEEIVEGALRQAPPSSFDAILRLALRFGLAVNVDNIEDSALRFVRAWADHPRGYDLRSWPCGAELDALLNRELSSRIARDARLAVPIGDDWWELRWQTSRYLASEADSAVVAAAALYLPPQPRAMLIKSTLAAATDAKSFAVAANALWWRVKPSVEDLRMLAKQAPAGTSLDPAFFDDLSQDLQGVQLTPDMLMLGHRLEQKGLWRPNAKARQLLEADLSLRRLARLLETSRDGDGVPDAAIAKFSGLSAHLVALWTPSLGEVLSQAGNPALVQHVLAGAPLGVQESFAGIVLRAMRSKPPQQMVANMIYVAFTATLPPHLADALGEACFKWLKGAGRRKVEPMGEKILGWGPLGQQIWVTLTGRPDAGGKSLWAWFG